MSGRRSRRFSRRSGKNGDWLGRRESAENPSAAFYWHQLGGEPVNQKLLPPLRAQTQEHCSFCDGYPVAPPSIETIEHFRPKAQFPREAYHWPNLYFCCMFCQQKDGNFDETILRPDTADYSFERYFRWDFTLGTVEVNDQASPDDQLRAEKTRSYFRFNSGHPTWRRLFFHRRAKLQDEPIDSFPYRHFLEANAA